MPEVWRARSRRVIERRAGTVASGAPPAPLDSSSTPTLRAPSSGMWRSTASASESLPSSCSIMIAVPTSGFVIEAMAKMPSRGIGVFFAGST